MNIFLSEVTLDVSRSEYVISAAGGLGIKVSIHEPHVYPRLNEHSISISPGVDAFIELKKVIEKTLRPPYSSVECVSTDTKYNFKHSPNAEYNYEACMLDCMYDFVFLDGCNCSFTGDDHGRILCSLDDYYFCLDQKFQEYYTNDCDCLHPCNEVNYEYSMSMLEYPTPMIVEVAKRDNWPWQTKEDIKNNVIHLYVYYKSLDYTEVEQVPAYKYDALMADLGGLLGLFLGASLVTLLEIFEFAIVLGLKKLGLLSTKSKEKVTHVINIASMDKFEHKY